MKKNIFLSLVLFFTLALCLSAPASAASFEDVSDDAYYASAVEWAVDAGVTNGIGNNQFGVNDNVTRAQAVTFLWRAMGTPASKGTSGAFEDVEPGSWYENAVQWAVENKITEGVGDNKFAPDGQVTRGQMITFLYRAKGQPGENRKGDKWFSAAKRWAQSKGLLNGTSQIYTSNGECPRCDVVYYLWKEVQNIGNADGTGKIDPLQEGRFIPEKTSPEEFVWPDEIPDNLVLQVDENGNLYYLEVYPEEFSSLEEYEEFLAEQERQAEENDLTNTASDQPSQENNNQNTEDEDMGIIDDTDKPASPRRALTAEDIGPGIDDGASDPNIDHTPDVDYSGLHAVAG